MASRCSFQANPQLKNVCLVHRAVCDFCIAPAHLDLRDACYFSSEFEVDLPFFGFGADFFFLIAAV